MENLAQIDAMKENELKEQLGRAYYQSNHTRFVCRLVRDKVSGRLKEEYKTLKNGTKIHVVFPWSPNRAAKETFREMNLKEIDDWKKALADEAGVVLEEPEKRVVSTKIDKKPFTGKALKEELNL
jgi:hypothetical protein